MAIDFPDDPNLNDEYTVGNRTWTWNNTGWFIKHNDLIDVPPFPWPTTVIDASYSTLTANAIGEGMGTVLRMPVDGSLMGGRFRLGTVTTGGTMTVRVETVSATTGLNSGSLIAAGATASVVVADSDDGVFKNYTLNTPVTLARGDLIAIIETTDAVENLQLVTTNATPNGVLPYGLNNSSGAFSKDPAHPVHSLYVDNTWVTTPGLWPFNDSTTATAVSSATTPDEIGNLITMPATMRISGVHTMIASVADGDDFQICLYNSNDTLIDSITQDGGQTDSGGLYQVHFPTSHILTGGASYRLTLKGTGGALNFYQSNLDSATYTSLLPGGGNVIATHRTDAGAWTDTNTRFSWIVPLMDGIYTPAGEKI